MHECIDRVGRCELGRVVLEEERGRKRRRRGIVLQWREVREDCGLC